MPLLSLIATELSQESSPFRYTHLKHITAHVEFRNIRIKNTHVPYGNAKQNAYSLSVVEK